MLDYLLDRERYATLGRDAVAVIADMLTEKGVVPTSGRGFSFSRIERFACGSPVEVAHWIAVYTHNLTGLEFSLIPAAERSAYWDDALAHWLTRLRDPIGPVDHPMLVCRTPCTQAAWVQNRKRKNSSRHRNPQKPVDSVSIERALRWCASAGLSLPNGLEWEYVCRSGTTTKYSTGDSISEADAWYYKHATGACEVGQYAPNAFGLFDLHGTIKEWCSGIPSPNLEGGVLVGYRFTCGGGFAHHIDDLRSEAFVATEGGEGDYETGFRPVHRLSDPSA